MYGYDPYSKMMQMAGGQGNIDYSQQQVGQDMGNFNPEANSGNDGLIGSILSKALSSYGPVGGAVGGGVGAILDSGGKVGQNGEDRGLGQSVAQGAAKGAMNAFANDMLSSPNAGDAFGMATSQASDAAVNAGGNSLLASDALTNSPSLGDAFKTSMLDGQKLATDPSVYQASDLGRGAYPTMQTGTTPSFVSDAMLFAEDVIKDVSRGLIGGTYDSMPDKGSFSANFRQGFKGGDASNMVGNLRDGNFGSAVGQGTKFVTSSYKPPAYDADKYKQKFMINY